MPGTPTGGESRRALRVPREWLRAWWHRRVPFAISVGLTAFALFIYSYTFIGDRPNGRVFLHQPAGTGCARSALPPPAGRATSIPIRASSSWTSTSARRKFWAAGRSRARISRTCSTRCARTARKSRPSTSPSANPTKRPRPSASCGKPSSNGKSRAGRRTRA